MMLFYFLEQKLNSVHTMLNELIETFKKLENKHNLEASAKIYDDIRAYIEVNEEMLYPAIIKQVPNGQALIEPALQRHRDIEEIMEKSTMIHVDEPSFEFLNCLVAIRDQLGEEVAYTAAHIWPVIEAHVPAETIEKIEGRLDLHQEYKHLNSQEVETTPEKNVVRTLKTAI